MMKAFAVVQTEVHDFAALVLATGASLPQTELEDVASELRLRRIAGTAVFDLLTSNGSRSRRFFALGFDGRDFASEGGLTAIEPPVQVRAVATTYLHDHCAELDLCLLTPAMRFAVNRGVTI